eukprot:5603482-Prymnesium_polylepis.1
MSPQLRAGGRAFAYDRTRRVRRVAARRCFLQRTHARRRGRIPWRMADGRWWRPGAVSDATCLDPSRQGRTAR